MALPLPDELVELTFSFLDIPSLLRCMRVCKLFHSVVSGSTLLSYKIELFASYMEDNELSPMDVVTRFNLLREHNRVWNDMEWPSSGSIPMLDSYWEFSGGVFAQATHENEIFFIQLPCNLKGIAETRWSAQFDFAIRDFTFDNSQDLIVLVELVGNFPDISCNVHLRTLYGKHHPRANVSQITHDLGGLQAEFIFLMQIYGNHIAILFNDEFNAFFAIWNWRTGHQKVDIRTPNFRSFAFMTEDLILAGIVEADIAPALRVLSIAACVNPIRSLEDMPYICELQYPKSSGSTDYFLIRSEPTPSWRPPLGSGVPFYCSRKDFIFTISVRHSSVFFVHLSTLLVEVERSRNIQHRRNVAWADWGHSGAYMIYGVPDETWVRYTYGLKFIHSSPGETQRQVARVYDFNPHVVRKYMTPTINSSISWGSLASASDPFAQCACEVCREESTTLLGRVISVKLGDSPGVGGAGWAAVMIGEDHILMAQPASKQYGYMAM